MTDYYCNVKPSTAASTSSWTVTINKVEKTAEYSVMFRKSCYLHPLNIKYRYIMEQVIGLNAAQMDFLQLLAHIKTTEELEELSQVVSDYYARKAEEGMNRLWETGQWSKEKDEEVMRTHLRTPYKYAK